MQSRTLRGLVVYCTPIQQCRSDIGAESLDHVFGDLRVRVLLTGAPADHTNPLWPRQNMQQAPSWAHSLRRLLLK